MPDVWQKVGLWDPASAYLWIHQRVANRNWQRGRHGNKGRVYSARHGTLLVVTGCCRRCRAGAHEVSSFRARRIKSVAILIVQSQLMSTEMYKAHTTQIIPDTKSAHLAVLDEQIHVRARGGCRDCFHSAGAFCDEILHCRWEVSADPRVASLWHGFLPGETVLDAIAEQESRGEGHAVVRRATCLCSRDSCLILPAIS